MSRAMPSPNGTNYAGLFMPSGPVAAAYDAALADSDAADPGALMDDDGSPIADSTQAHRILLACIDKLSKDDLGRVVEMLSDAKLLSPDEARSITGAMSENMASDAAIMARRLEQVRAGQRSYSDLRQPITRPVPDADERRFNEMFPDANRIRRV